MSSPIDFRRTAGRRAGAGAAVGPARTPAARRPAGPATRAGGILRELSTTRVNQVLAFAEYLRSQARNRDASLPLLTTGFDLVAEKPAPRRPRPSRGWLGLAAQLAGATLLVAVATAGGLRLFHGAPDGAQETTPATAVRAETGAEVSAAESPAQAPAAPPPFRAYTVQPGDSLSLIAERFLGSSAAWPRIQQANPGLLDDPEWLEAGEVIRIPTLPSREPGAGD